MVHLRAFSGDNLSMLAGGIRTYIILQCFLVTILADAPRGQQATVYSLLDNGFIAVSSDTTRFITPGSPSLAKGRGQFLALSQDKSRLYALISPDIVVIDTVRLEITRTIALPPLERLFTAIVVGPRSGHLYVFASTDILVVDPVAGGILDHLSITKPAGYDWQDYSAAVSPQETQLYISYHGGDRIHGMPTSGADWLTLHSGQATLCENASAPIQMGCIKLHGKIVADSEGLLAATGGQYIVRVDSSHHIAMAYDTGLTGNHLMEFALSSRQNLIWAIGSCFYGSSGGLAGISQNITVAAGPNVTLFNTLIPIRSEVVRYAIPDICGERVAVSSSGLVAVGEILSPGATRSRIVLFHPDDGSRETIDLPAVIRDLVAN
jgi:hypothetical protein